MPTLTVAPRFSITENRLQGCTSWFLRALTLFSYGRCLSVNKRLGHLIVSTRRAWLHTDIRVIGFDSIDYIVYRAQALPSLFPWHYLSDDGSAGWAFFIVSLALKGEEDEVPLFTLWQSQPRSPDLIDKMMGDEDTDKFLGDESARTLIDSLHSLTGAGIRSKN